MQTLTTASNKAKNELQGLNSDLSPREKAAREFIVSSFAGKMSSLIPLALENISIINLASYLLKYTKAKSKHTLYQYVFGVHRFCDWEQATPDNLVKDVKTGKEAIDKLVMSIDDFIGDLQAEKLAQGTINNHVKGVKALLRANGTSLPLLHPIPKDIKYPDRAPTPEELTRIIDTADIREKVIVCILALSGVREGTLAKLQYRHVKHDLERGMVPIHMHIEAEITKGKYHEYDTFIGAEGAEFLKTYLTARKIGNVRWESGKLRGMPPEQITDSSPLIRNEHKTKIEPITEGAIWSTIHSLLRRTGIIGEERKVRYDVRPHSIRKYFRTQLGAISTIKNDYIDYMMGHTVSTYNDIKGQGVEALRNLYLSSGLGIRPKTTLSKLDQVKIFARSLGLIPEDILSKDAIVTPHRTIVNPENRQMQVLNQALKQAIILELKNQTSIP
jgi:integrase